MLYPGAHHPTPPRYRTDTDRDLAEVAGRAALHEGHLGGQTHAVHVVTRCPVVQRVQHQREALEEVDPVLLAAD